ncbi:hypothetical protein AAHC03_016905 [Spirometra sp. Aus1]
MELLGDVTRRLKCRPAIQIPVHELFVAYNDPECSTYLTNFSHMYIRMGYPRMPLLEQIRLLPVLYASLTDNKPIVQRDVLLHLTLPVIGHVTVDNCSRREMELHELPVQRRFISEFYSLVLLLPYRFERLIRFDSNDATIPDGFNAYDYSRVAHDRFSMIHSAEDLEKFKVAVVNFFSRGFFPADESILPLLFANADTRHSVVSASDRQLHILDRLVDWEDEALLTHIFDWFLGRRREFDPKGRSEPRRPLSAQVRVRLGTFLLRSRLTLVGPLAPDLIEAAVLSLRAVSSQNETQQQQPPAIPATNATDSSADQTESAGPTAGISQQRCGQSVASRIQQRRLAELGLNFLNHFLDNAISIPTTTSIRALRGLINFVYENTSDDFVPSRARGFELLSRFLAREPDYLLKDPGQLPRLFDVLSEDIAPDLKTAAAHCLRRLAVTFQEAQRLNHPALRSQLVKLERLLYENMERSDPLSRLVAVNFAGVIYPPDHIPTRYLILQALGDKDARVRAEARNAFSIFLDPNVANDIVYGRVKLPSFVEFVNHDTQHSRKNPFIDVERLIPVVQFIRLCLLAVKGGLSPAQDAAMIYETDDEIRYRINQNVRYFLSAPKSAEVGGGTAVAGTASASVGGDSAFSGQKVTAIPNPEQARRSIDTYFRLIHVVIFARSQTTRDSPEFPNFLEEVLVNNTKELITGGKPIFERMNSLLLATPRGANCRHACASIYSVVTMETETPTAALQTAFDMLADVPKDAPVIDAETCHTVQGMMMGAAYLLKHLHDKYGGPNASGALSSSGGQATTSTTTQGNGSASNGASGTPNTSSGEAKSKRSKKQESKNKSQLQTGINAAIDQFLKLLDIFLVRPTFLLDKPLGKETPKGSVGGGKYINASVAQSSVTALLESLAVLAQAGCLARLPAGTMPSGSPLALDANSPMLPCGASKANLVTRVASYLSLPFTTTVLTGNGSGTGGNAEAVLQVVNHQRVWFAALRALAGLCTGEPAASGGAGVSQKGKKGTSESQSTFSSHPHLLAIIKVMSSLEEIRDPALHLAIGAAMTDCLLGSASPYRGLWYERSYPLTVPPGAEIETANSPAGQWLAQRFSSLLTHHPGQVQPPPSMIAAALWALAMVRRFGPPPVTLLPAELFISLLTENDETIQCIAASVLGLIYDRSGEETRAQLSRDLNKVIREDNRPSTSVFRELCSLTAQIGRPDLILPLIVLATTPLPPSVNTSALLHSANCLDPVTAAAGGGVKGGSGGAAGGTPWLTLCSVACAGLVRRLGRSVAPALPRLVPRLFIRRFDFARPRLRQAVQAVWLGLILYAMPSAAVAAAAAATASGSGLSASVAVDSPSPPPSPSLNAMAADLVEAHFNAIVCEIKTQLGFNTPTTSPSSSTSCTGSSAAAEPAAGGKLRDACCLAVVALTEHPSAYKRLAGHLPSLLSGLLGLVDDDAAAAASGSYEQAVTSSEPSLNVSAAEKAAVAIQGLVRKALEDPSSREVAAGLLPALLPILIDRALSTAAPCTGTLVPSESRRFALDLLLEAARIARPSALRSALPQLTLAGLQTMATLSPARVISVMTSSQKQETSTQSNIVCKEEQMAKVLRLCVRLIDEASLSRLIMPLTEMIRAGGGPSTASIGASSATGGARGTGSSSAAAMATAACVFLSFLASSSSSLVTAPAPTFTVPSTPDPSAAEAQQHQKSTDEATGAHTCADVGNSGAMKKTTTSEQPRPQQQQQPTQSCAVVAGANAANSMTTTTVSTSIAARRRFPCPAVSRVGKGATGASAVGVAAPSTPNSDSTDSTTSSPHGGTTTTTTTTITTVSLLAPHTGKLLAALLWALPGAGRQVDASSRRVVQEEMARTLAVLLTFAKDTSVAKVFSRIRSWFLETNGAAENASTTTANNSGQWACASAMHAIASYCPELIFAHAGLTLPLIFINKQCESDLLQITLPTGSNVTRDDPALSLSLTAGPVLTSVGGILPVEEDVENRRLLWKETWDKIIPNCALPSALLPAACSCSVAGSSPQHLPLASMLQLSADAEPPSATLFPLTGLLKPPLLTAFVSSLSEALLKSPSWFVRNQAGLALLSVSAAIVSQPMLVLTTAASTLIRDVSALVYLLRAARMLAQSALERGFSAEEANSKLIEQLWSSLVRETRSGRAESAGAGYQAEAFLALANFAEATGRDATGLTKVTAEAPSKASTDRLTVLLRLILPNGLPKSESGKQKHHQQQSHLSADLTEAEQEIAIRAVGILWPMQPLEEHLTRFTDTLRHLTFIMTQGGWRLQAAALASILAIFVKITPAQSKELVDRLPDKSKAGEQLGLKDLMTRLKRAVDNTKSQILREHALGAIASILRHPEFVNIVRDQLHQLVQAYASSGASSLREWSSALLKGL